MATGYDLPFDQIRANILQDIQNAYADNGLPEADVAEGSDNFIKASIFASSLWGAYKQLLWVYRQIFPDTCQSTMLDHHCNVLTGGTIARETIVVDGVSTKESDGALLARLLAYLREPPAGGNANDFTQWAIDNGSYTWSAPPVWAPGATANLCDIITPSSGDGRLFMCVSGGTTGATAPTWPAAGSGGFAYEAGESVAWQEWEATGYVETIDSAIVYCDHRGAGTVDVVISSSYAREVCPNRQSIPSNALVAAVTAYIQSVRPVAEYDIVVQPPQRVVVGASDNPGIICLIDEPDTAVQAQLETEIAALIDAMPVGQTFYTAQITAFLVNAGYQNPVLYDLDGNPLVNEVILPSANASIPGYATYQRAWAYGYTEEGGFGQNFVVVTNSH